MRVWDVLSTPMDHGKASRSGLWQAEVSRTEDKTYSSLSEVPGTMVERHAVEDERFTAGALYNLASSSTGVTNILDTGDNAVLGEPLFLLIMQPCCAYSSCGCRPWCSGTFCFWLSRHSRLAVF